MNDDCKKKCQIFTPIKNVIELMNWVGYKKNLCGKKVLEPTFGKGNILIKIVERYIKDCINNGFSPNKIRCGLENDIYGFEYDEKYYNMCLDSLNNLCLKYNISNVKWKLYCGDFLNASFEFSFDYILGNPPYISYKLLDNDTRFFVKNNFKVCSCGKFDYCYAFIEKSVDLLALGGRLAFLIPSSIFKNVFSYKLRSFILNDLIEIHDYDSRKLFNEEGDGTKRNILTTSSIIVIKRGSNQRILKYVNEVDKSLSTKLLKKTLGSKWVFSNEIRNCGKYRFGDYFKASNTVATLCNKAYVINQSDELYNCSEKILFDGVSPRGRMLHTNEKIIFPYYFVNGEINRFSEEDFEREFPNCCNHLKYFLNDLNRRKSDSNIKWFEYGRSQALSDMYKEKLLISIVVTKRINVYKLMKNMIPYSGIYIISTSDMPLDKAKHILESNRFYEYIKAVGINASGTSFRITSKDINNYYFD